MGACCLANFTCIQTTQNNCPTPPNSFWVPNTACLIGVCPTGVCCDPSTGVCTISFGACIIPQTFIASVTCLPNNPCPQPTGACCFSNGTCAQLTANICVGAGGSYQGNGVPCVSLPCPGACCAPNGSCSITIPFNCPNLGGQTFLGTGTVCVPNPCPQPTGACCTGPIYGGVGNVCVQTTPSACAGLLGQWQGFGTPCASPPASSNFTTCCYANCDGLGGISVGDIFCFLSCYFSGNIACADCDGNGIIGVGDIFCFLAAYFSGCS